MTTFDLPERLELARLPTPVERLGRLSAELGVDLWVKRDDCTGAALSGNKIRKLEFVLAAARRAGADCVITTGGVQSNHCRATAVAARRLGWAPHLLLRTPDGEAPTVSEGNLMLDRVVGAEIRTIAPERWGDRNTLMAAWAEELTAAGRTPFVIPEGASDATGALGYAHAVQELAAQLPGGMAVDYLAHAVGSGGTTAGLALGTAAYYPAAHAVGYAVCDDVAYFTAKIDGIIAEVRAARGAVGTPAYTIVDDFKGVGYALNTPQELAFITEVACTEGLILDPVYSGKAFRGMVEEIRTGARYEPGATIVFVHTGGIFGLLAKHREFTFSA